MPYELDHVFICTALDAPEAERLVAFGLTEGTRNVHPGQGTANRRFFFHNAMLELLWVHNAPDARSDPVQRLGLLERWRYRGRTASPFGICLRPLQGPKEEPPFPAWAYRPPYLPDPLVIYVATNSMRVDEPLLFYMPHGRRPDTASKQEPLSHKAGFQRVTAVRVGGPSAEDATAEMQAAARTGAVSFIAADAYLMEIGFDGERQGEAIDFRPALPLRFCW